MHYNKKTGLLDGEVEIPEKGIADKIMNTIVWGGQEKTPQIEYTHPDCEHACTSNCRREGCNCECGEWHGRMTKDEYEEAVSDLNAELSGAEVDSY